MVASSASPTAPNNPSMPTPPETAAPAAASGSPSSPGTASAAAASGSCLVQTTIGPIEGFIDPAFPGVRQWLGVPFAEPPVGGRRFLPPEPKKALPASKDGSGGAYSATKMPPAPMQAYTTKPDLYAKYVPEFLSPGPYSEDCLYLNVFAPTLRQKKTGNGEEEEGGEDDEDDGPLPTLVFFYGGEGEWGGVNAEYLQPQAWVQRSQKQLVVLFNWRVGIFGFPNARGLGHRALGLLDQRLALEFIRDNIQAFGGSPSNIVAFGHAAGSGSIEAHLFAWPEDPIVSAAICISGFLSMGGTNRDMDRASFSLLAQRLGCPEHATPEEEVTFLRGVDAGAILGCFRVHNDSGAQTRLFFRPQVDGVVLFSPEEQAERARQGKFARVPMLLGMTADDGNALVPCLGMAAEEDDVMAAAAEWTGRIENAVLQVIGYRLEHGCTTYRCVYAGNFANISPRPWMKAYHFSELPMLMGTHEIERGPSTDFQRQLSATMQDMWVDFARDPEKGLQKQWGWTPVGRDSASAMVLGKDGVLFQQGNKSFGELPLVGKRKERQSG